MKEQTLKYSIGTTAKLLHIPDSTIRYYEKEGILQIPRNLNGQRYFLKEDIEWLKFIQHLKGTGMSIDDLKQYVTWRAEGDTTIKKRLALLKSTQIKLESSIVQTQKHLEILTDKINWYEEKLHGSINDNESFREYLKRFGHEE
ncbi:MAG: MerR family transcriptional regulator [Liquorilactobacillus hordei]|uniref:MerR family transcriptional regulator n=2 Tax=Liquorilactobacillus hordei TaxID=468911 RepID=UPI0039ECB845